MTTSIKDLLNKKKQGYEDKRMGSKNAYKFKSGTTKVRILPTWRKDGEEPIFSHPFGQSFIKNMDQKVIAVIGAKNIAYGENDEVQNLIVLAKNNALTDSQRQHWDDCRAKNRELVNALILDDKECDPNVAEIVDFSSTQFETIIQQIELAGIEDEFLDLKNGFNLIVSKTGSGKQNTKYSFTFERKASEVNPAVMETVTDLDAYVRSKMVDTDRAINAIKSITTGSEHLALTHTGSIVDAAYTTIDGDDDTPPFEVDNVRETMTAEEIDGLFTED